MVPSRKEDKELEKSSDNADQSVVTSEGIFEKLFI